MPGTSEGMTVNLAWVGSPPSPCTSRVSPWGPGFPETKARGLDLAKCPFDVRSSHGPIPRGRAAGPTSGWEKRQRRCGRFPSTAVEMTAVLPETLTAFVRGGVQEYVFQRTLNNILVLTMLTAHFEIQHFRRCDGTCASSSITAQLLTVRDETMIVLGAVASRQRA